MILRVYAWMIILGKDGTLPEPAGTVPRFSRRHELHVQRRRDADGHGLYRHAADGAAGLRLHRKARRHADRGLARSLRRPLGDAAPGHPAPDRPRPRRRRHPRLRAGARRGAGTDADGRRQADDDGLADPAAIRRRPQLALRRGHRHDPDGARHALPDLHGAARRPPGGHGHEHPSRRQALSRPRPLTHLLFVYLYAPLAVIVVYSFNANRVAGVWTGFSLKWYGSALEQRGADERALRPR
jgi:hypothetical protein